MHVLQLANFYSDTSGGLRTVMVELARGYVERGHRVTRIVPGPVSESFDDDGTSVIAIESPKIPGSGGYRAITSASAVERMINDLRPDVIELSDKSTLAIAAGRARRRFGIPVVLISHERIDKILSPRLPRLFPLAASADAWNRRLADRVDAIVCASWFAAQEFDRIGARQIHRMPLGVDLEQWHPGSRRGRGGETATIVMVGRLSAEKHPMRGIETMRELGRRGVVARLVVAGDGPMRTELVEAARGLPVEFVGHLADRGALATLVADADMALAPCPFETFGLAALEAMAAGTPVVVPSAGALPELTTASTARVVSGSADSFADAVESLLAGDRDNQRAACRQHAEHYSWTKMVASMCDLMIELSARDDVSARELATVGAV